MFTISNLIYFSCWSAIQNDFLNQYAMLIEIIYRFSLFSVVIGLKWNNHFEWFQCLSHHVADPLSMIKFQHISLLIFTILVARLLSFSLLSIALNLCTYIWFLDILVLILLLQENYTVKFEVGAIFWYWIFTKTNFFQFQLTFRTTSISKYSYR